MALIAPRPAEGREIGIPPPPIYNFYGQVGLLDMPTAQFAPDGELAISMSTTKTLDRYNLTFQAFPWLEAAFRYSRLDRANAGTDLYDRSLSFKIRLADENADWPSIAIGVQDILGTGVFGAEYLVASKHIGDFNVSGGIGWRRFSGIAQFDNPLGLIFPSFKNIDNNFGLGGVPSLNSFFHGPKIGLFGGVTWQTPIDRLAIIAEASGDQFTAEQKTGAINVRTPFNFGFAYTPWDGVQIGGGYFYGSEFGLRLTLSMNAFDEQPSPRIGTRPIPWHVRDPDDRTNATLAYLQDKTHYYDNNPWDAALKLKELKISGYQPVQRPPDRSKDVLLADAVYSPAGRAQLEVKNIESFGDDLILTISNERKITCPQISEITQAAAATDFKNVVLLQARIGSVQICEVGAVSPNNIDPAWIAASMQSADSAVPTPQQDVPAPVTISEERSAKDEIVAAIKEQNIGVAAIHLTDHEVEVAFVNGTYWTDPEAIGRLLRVLMKTAPLSVEKFRLVEITQNLPTSEMTFIRSDLERTLDMAGSASELLPSAPMLPVSANDPLLSENSLREFPNFEYSITPGYRQSLFDPNQPYRFQIYANASAGVTLTENLSISGNFEAVAFSDFKNDRLSNSILPHVRSDYVQYYTHGKNGIGSLQASYFDKLSPDVYLFVRGGILEDMYDGIGGEVYWQPTHTRWALGGALYAVQQRSFERLLGLRNYKVITGHASLYYNSPYYGLDFAVHAGRYLAGDYGATFEIKRRFANGIEIGVYATLTNVPFKDYGEGSFDKGFIVRIPIDVFLPVNTQNVANLDFSPLTRDGGQRLYGEQMLHDLLLRSSEGEFLATWDKVLNP